MSGRRAKALRREYASRYGDVPSKTEWSDDRESVRLHSRWRGVERDYKRGASK